MLQLFNGSTKSTFSNSLTYYNSLDGKLSCNALRTQKCIVKFNKSVLGFASLFGEVNQSFVVFLPMICYYLIKMLRGS